MADATTAASPTAALAGPASSPVSGKKAPAQKKAATGSTSSGAKGSARSKPSHPPTSDMVNNAIKSLKERGGSSLQAVKKFVSANYKVDAEKLSPFIKKYLKSAVVSGTLVQTKGKGASGSFKLAGAGGPSTASSKTAAAASVKSRSTGKPASNKAAAKRASTGKAKPIGTKKPKTQRKLPGGTAVKKAVSKKKTSASQASSSAVAVAPPPSAKAKSPSKAKKTNKMPTKKPKAPKPKKAKSAPVSPKKTGGKKK